MGINVELCLKRLIVAYFAAIFLAGSLKLPAKISEV
jgi:hypothetical protein